MNKSTARRVTTSVPPISRTLDNANAAQSKLTIYGSAQVNMDLAAMLHDRLVAVETFLESQNNCDAAGPELTRTSVIEVLDYTTNRLNGMVYTMNRLELLLGMVPAVQAAER